MITRKKVSKRKILQTLGAETARLKFFEELSNTALAALHKADKGHAIFQGSAAIAILREQQKRQREDRLTWEYCLLALILGFGIGVVVMLFILTVK